MVKKSNNLNERHVRIYKDVVVNIPPEIKWKQCKQDVEVSTKIKEKWLAVRELNHSRRKIISPKP